MPVNFEILADYVPESSLPILKKWFEQRPFELNIKKRRSTKYGDFRPSEKNKIPRISVNSNLNKYAFLITLTHEFAHLLVWHRYKNKVKAHGEEWKTEFASLIHVLVLKKIFPEHIEKVLVKHIKNPPASSARDVKLVYELRKYDERTEAVYLSEVPNGATFTINNKRFFIKGTKKRTRFLCTEVSTKREFLIHGIAEVIIIKI